MFQKLCSYKSIDTRLCGFCRLVSDCLMNRFVGRVNPFFRVSHALSDKHSLQYRNAFNPPAKWASSEEEARLWQDCLSKVSPAYTIPDLPLWQRFVLGGFPAAPDLPRSQSKEKR